MAGPKLTPIHLSMTISMTFAGGLLYGLYLVTYGYANRWLIFTDEGWRLRKRYHWLMITITNIIGILSLADVAGSIQVLISQMTFIDDGHRPETWANPPWSPIVKCTISNVIALLADIVLMYRLWVVYGRRMRIMWLPILLWVGGLVCTILEIFLQVVHIHDPDFGPYEWAAVNMSAGPGIVLVPFWLSTILLNAYCTGLLIWKIWRASKREAAAGMTRQLQFLVCILTESGILYLLVGLANFFVWLGKNGFAISVLGTINTTVVAIAFNLVLIRTAQNKAEGEEFGGVQTNIHFNTKLVPDVQISVETAVESYDPEEARMDFRKSRG